MPGFPGKRIMFGDLILPKTQPPVKLKVIAFGNGGAWPVIRGSRDAPLRRVSDPEGRPLHPCAYRLPHDVRDRLAAALKPLRNRDACMALATFIGRFWTAPKRLGLPFMLDRRALAPIETLDLTEARVRGAIRALERVGFIERMPASGRTHQATPDGLHRKPVAFTFGSDYREAFSMANKRAQAASNRRSQAGRTPIPVTLQRASTATPAVRPANSPKYNPSEASRSIWARTALKLPQSALQNSALEAALDHWKMAFEKAKAAG
jgi:hypothetical protein